MEKREEKQKEKKSQKDKSRKNKQKKEKKKKDRNPQMQDPLRSYSYLSSKLLNVDQIFVFFWTDNHQCILHTTINTMKKTKSDTTNSTSTKGNTNKKLRQKSLLNAGKEQIMI